MARAGGTANTSQLTGRCPICGALLALVGRSHNCRPRNTEVGIPTTGPKPKLSGGALTEAGVERVLKRLAAETPKLTLKPTHFVVPLAKGASSFDHTAATAEFERCEEIVEGAIKKHRAAKGTGTYPGYRDPSTRRVYMKDYMQKRRALKKLLTEPSVLEKA